MVSSWLCDTGSVMLALWLFKHTQGEFVCRQLVGQHQGTAGVAFLYIFFYLNFFYCGPKLMRVLRNGWAAASISYRDSPRVVAPSC